MKEAMVEVSPRTGGYRRAVVRGLTLVALSAFLYGCTGGASCGSGASGCVNGYAYPQSGLSNGVAPVDDGVRLRMTQATLDFLRDHLRDVLLGAFQTVPGDPNTLRYNVGSFALFNSSYGNARIGQRPNGSTFPTYVLIDATDLADRLTFEFVEGAARDGIRVRIADLPVGLQARAYADWTVAGITGTAGCDIRGTQCPPGDPSCGIVTTLTLDVNVFPDVGQGAQCDFGAPECFLVDVQVADFALGTVDSGSLEISLPPYRDISWSLGDLPDLCVNGCDEANAPALCEPECSDHCSVDPFSAQGECSGLCGAADFLADVAAEIGGFLEDALQPALSAALETAIQDALADFDGSPISASDRVGLYALAPDIVNPTTLDLGYMIAPTGDAFDVNCPSGQNCAQTKGMDFVMKSGFEAAPPAAGEDGSVPHPCVNPVVGADFAALYGNGEFFAPDAQPLDGAFEGVPYHLGASIARQGLNQALFSTYNSGVLCIEVDSDAVHVLSNGAFPLTAGTLDLLTEGKLRQFAPPSAPAVITVVPSGPPVMRFGAGTEEEGHMIIEWPEVIVSFYVLVYERYARVFAVNTDISAQVTVFADPDTESLRLAIVDGPNIDNFTERYNELLPGVAFDEVLESLVGLAFDALLGEDLGFGYNLAGALSDALGVPLYVDFRGLETTPATGEREFFNFYLSLSDTPPQPRTASVPMGLRLAEDAGLYRLPELASTASAPAARRSPTGSARLIGADVPLRPGFEYFAQVDFGTWRGPFRPDADGGLVVEDPKLSLVGEHVIRVRGRRAGDAGSLAAPAEVVVWVDPLRPWAELAVADGVVRAKGSDIGSRTEDLMFSWSLDRGEWSEFDEERSRDLDDLDDVRHLSVRVRDEAGNVSRPVTLNLDSVRAARR